MAGFRAQAFGAGLRAKRVPRSLSRFDFRLFRAPLALESAIACHDHGHAKQACEDEDRHDGPLRTLCTVLNGSTALRHFSVLHHGAGRLCV